MFQKQIDTNPDDPDLRLDLSVCHDFLGELFRTLSNDPKQAEDNYRASLKIQEELVKRFPGNRDYHRELTRSHNNLGLLLTNIGRHEEAEKLLKDAIGGLEKLVALNPDIPEYQSELARANINLGVLMRQMKRPAESKTAYEKSIQLISELVNRHPDNHDFRYKLAVTRLNLGNVLQLTDFNDAEKIHLQANDDLKSLKDDYPGIPLYCQELANSYLSLGVDQANLGRMEDSQKTLEQARATLDHIEKERSEYAAYQSLYGLTMGSLSAVVKEQNEIEKAIAFVREAIEHQQKATKLNPKSPVYKNRLDRHKTFLQELEQAQKEKPAADSATKAEQK